MMGDDTLSGFRDDPYSVRDFPPDSSFPRFPSWLPPSAAHPPFSPSDPYSSDYPDSYRLPYYSPGHTRHRTLGDGLPTYTDAFHLTSEPPLPPDSDLRPFLASPPPFRDPRPTHFRFNSSPAFPAGTVGPLPAGPSAPSGTAGNYRNRPGSRGLHSRHASESTLPRGSRLPSRSPEDTPRELRDPREWPGRSEEVRSPAGNASKPAKEPSPVPTKLPYECRDFRSGKCTRGENCKFMHVQDRGSPRGGFESKPVGVFRGCEVEKHAAVPRFSARSVPAEELQVRARAPRRVSPVPRCERERAVRPVASPRVRRTGGLRVLPPWQLCPLSG